jgi:hypothetical protein
VLGHHAPRRCRHCALGDQRKAGTSQTNRRAVLRSVCPPRRAHQSTRARSKSPKRSWTPWTCVAALRVLAGIRRT